MDYKSLNNWGIGSAPADMNKLTIIKLDHQGNEVARYPGEILLLTGSKVVLKTYFAGNDIDVGGLVLRKGDRLHETFYFQRWYNIFEVYDADAGRVKGWYCNVSHPAEMDGNILFYKDLALDLLVFPDGRQIILDEDEFEDLHIPMANKENAISALQELQVKFRLDGVGQTPQQSGK
jgi:predicted RNA-binding protein associated with RNAse of E/G family